MRHIDKTQRGEILIVTLVMSAVFMILLTSLLDYLMTQYKWVDMNTKREQALHIAEAGVEYYRWHLAHWPEDLKNGTTTPGPYVHTYEDPEEGPIGQFSLEIGGEVLCGKTQVIHATSTGWTFAEPTLRRTIVVRIARPTVADYSYVVDEHVYAASSRVIIGPYHSNGAVRMNGDNRSAVTSKLGTINCSGSSGANLGGCTNGTVVNGVYGTGSHPEWWRTAQPDISFSNFGVDFDKMEGVATTSGIYLPKISNDTSRFGYYLRMRSDRKIDVYRVTSIDAWRSQTTPGGDTLNLPELGSNANSYITYATTVTIPDACPLIYVSDRTWIEGTVSGKVTVIANSTTTASVDLFLQNNLTYAGAGGVDGIAVLAERNLLIPLYVPTNMTIRGIFFAKSGSYGRSSYGGSSSYKLRNSLTTYGTVVSKKRTGTAWLDSDGDTVQGFITRTDSYDRILAGSPPPMTPYTSSDFRYIEWREVE
ncbi:MAG: hypothetical protein KBD24_04275 [Candidatus Pacebacteria bacterium]|nr:hypothetical protein [Candidatus Paceibacterota bacterium]